MTMKEDKASTTPEAIFKIPIDLEASLGKIEEGDNDGGCAMDVDEGPASNQAPRRRLTRTRSRALPGSEDRAVTVSPCRSKDPADSTMAADENMMVTEDMGDDCKVVSEVPTDLVDKVSDWRRSFDLELVPDETTACDDFSLTSHEADSMVGEELEGIADNLDGFWEKGTAVPTAATPSFEPTRVSISSIPDVRTM